MTTELETREATQAQYNVLRNYSRRIFGDEWYVTDTYQSDVLTFDEAGRLIEACTTLNQQPPDTKDLRKAALAALMAGETMPENKVKHPDQFGDIDGGISTTDVTTPSPDLSVETDPQPVVDTIEAYRSEHMDRKPFTGRHGTRKAFKWHETHGEAPCDECRAIVERVEPKEDTTETYRKQRALKPIEHGTRTGFQAHKRRNDTPCEDCKQANRDYNNRLRLAKNPELQPRGKARATSARVKVEKPARRRQTHSEERATSARPNARPVEGSSNGFRPIDQMPEALFMLLPNPGETFTEEAKKRWIAFATLTLDLVWPNE